MVREWKIKCKEAHPSNPRNTQESKEKGLLFFFKDLKNHLDLDQSFDSQGQSSNESTRLPQAERRPAFLGDEDKHW